MTGSFDLRADGEDIGGFAANIFTISKHPQLSCHSEQSEESIHV
jgi:hypothetical protein